MRFEWDPSKDRINRRQHGLGFDEVQELFTSGIDYLEIFDELHSDEQDRFIAIGPVRRGIVVIVWVERVKNVIRIISARFATSKESKLFVRRKGVQP